LILYKGRWKKDQSGESTIDKERFMKLCTGVWDMRTEMNGLTKANFPLELPLNCIDLLSYVGDVVLDPFSGSGTTLISGEMRKRKWIGIELSEKYCKIAMNRIKVVSEQDVLTDYGVV
jgi:site-specific DNA-methyltransferase (adenine-specific)